MFIITLIVSLVADFASKYLIADNLVPGESIFVIRGIFDLTYVQNRGAAFGIFYGNTILLVIVTSALLVGLFVYLIINKNKSPKLERFSLALIVAGGIGNLGNRLMLGYVIDFFNFYFWPVFNVADICICVGCGLLILSVLILEPMNKKNQNKDNINE